MDKTCDLPMASADAQEHCVAQQAVKEEINLHTIYPDMLGHILAQMVKIVGSTNIRNIKDLTVGTKYIWRLARVCKTLHAAVHEDDEVVKPIITAMAERFKLDLIEAAGILQTQSARRWVENFVQKAVNMSCLKECSSSMMLLYKQF